MTEFLIVLRDVSMECLNKIWNNVPEFLNRVERVKSKCDCSNNDKNYVNIESEFFLLRFDPEVKGKHPIRVQIDLKIIVIK